MQKQVVINFLSPSFDRYLAPVFEQLVEQYQLPLRYEGAADLSERNIAKADFAFICGLAFWQLGELLRFLPPRLQDRLVP